MTLLRMRSALLLLLFPSLAFADGWTDVPAMMDAAVKPLLPEIRGCSKTKRIGMTVTRTKQGTSEVGMPIPGLGYRGPTKEERCLGAAIAKIALPPLPAGIDMVGIGHTLDAAPADPAFDDWRDPAAAIAKAIDDKRRAALAACDRKPRTVRLILDLTHGKTRSWLPAWQFHSPSGDGSTPAGEARVKACMTKAIRGLAPPVLPRDMAELHLALVVTP